MDDERGTGAGDADQQSVQPPENHLHGGGRGVSAGPLGGGEESVDEMGASSFFERERSLWERGKGRDGM